MWLTSLRFVRRIIHFRSSLSDDGVFRNIAARDLSNEIESSGLNEILGNSIRRYSGCSKCLISIIIFFSSEVKKKWIQIRTIFWNFFEIPDLCVCMCVCLLQMLNVWYLWMRVFLRGKISRRLQIAVSRKQVDEDESMRRIEIFESGNNNGNYLWWFGMLLIMQWKKRSKFLGESYVGFVLKLKN